MKPTMVADECKLCASQTPPVRTKKFRPTTRALAVCPRCDRLQCKECRQPVYNGSASACHNGHVIPRPRARP